MDSNATNRLESFWKGLKPVDLTTLGILAIYAGLWGLRQVRPESPRSGFLLVLAICALGYLIIRGSLWARKHLLWSLRNRLITAYLFIAVVPVLMLLTMAGLAAYLLYWQLG